MKSLLRALLLIALLLPLTACPFGNANIQETLLWSHRVVGYTDTARQVIEDLYCSECPTHSISREQALLVARSLQRLHATHAQLYELFKAALVGRELVVTAEQKGKLDALALALGANVPDIGSLPSAAALKLQPFINALAESVRELTRRLQSVRWRASGVTLALTVAQVNDLAQLETQLRSVGADIAAFTPEN